MKITERIKNWLGGILSQSSYAGTFSEHISERISSPFVLSFSIAWVVHNYRLFFGVVFFDKDRGVEGCYTRYELIKSMIASSTFCDLLWWPLGFSMLAVLSYNIFNQIPKAIRAFFEWVIEPYWVEKIGGAAKSVTKEKAEGIIRENYDLKIKGSQLIDDLSKEQRLYSETNNKLQVLELSYAKKNIELERLQKIENDYSKLIESKLQSEIDHERKIQVLNENFESKIGELKSTLTDGKRVESLNIFFSEEWICEYQYHNMSKGAVLFGFEKFTIANELYYVGKILEHTISSIRVSKTEDTLYFTKTRAKNIKEIIEVKLFKINPYYWLGIEFSNSFNFSFVRYYKRTLKPDHTLSYEINNDNNKIDYLTEFQKHFKLI